MTSATPRKFDEKIAIQKQKTHEDLLTFNAVMEESRKARAEQSSMAMNNGDLGDCTMQQVQGGGGLKTGGGSMSGLVSISGHGLVSPVSSGGSTSGGGGTAPQSRYLCPSYPNHVSGRAGSLPNVTQLLRHQAPPRNGIQEAVNALNILSAESNGAVSVVGGLPRRGSSGVSGGHGINGVIHSGSLGLGVGVGVGCMPAGTTNSMMGGLERRLSRSSDGRGSGRGASSFLQQHSSVTQQQTSVAAGGMSSNLVVQQQQQISSSSPNHCPTPISRHRIDTSPYGNYLLPINNDNMYRRTISDSRLYESASQPRQVPVPGIPFRPPSEYGPGPAPKLSFKSKARGGGPIHFLADRRKMSDDLNAVSYNRADFIKASRGDFPMHHSSPSPDSSAQQSPDTGSPATPGTRQHSLTVASPPILNCAGVLNNPSTPTAPNINIPMQVDSLNSVLCPPVDAKLGPCNGGVNTPGGSLPDLSSFSPGGGPGSSCSPHHPMLQGCYPPTLNGPGISSIGDSSPVGGGCGGRLGGGYMMDSSGGAPLQLLPPHSGHAGVSMMTAVSQHDPMLSHILDGVAVISPSSCSLSSSTHQRHHRLPLHRTCSNTATCTGQVSGASGSITVGSPVGVAATKYSNSCTTQQIPPSTAQSLQQHPQVVISNRNHPQQLIHHQNSRGGIHRIGAPQHVATAGNAATATVIGGVMDRRNGYVAFSTSPHLPGANSSIGGSCGGGGGGVGATLTNSFGGNGAKPNINSNQNHNLVHNQAGQTPAAIAISIPAPAGASSSGSSAPVRRHFVQQQSSSLPYHTILSTSPLEPLHIAADTCCWADLLGGESNVLSSGSNQAPSDITSFASDNSSVCLPLNVGGGGLLNCSTVAGGTPPHKLEPGLDLSTSSVGGLQGRVCSSVDPYAAPSSLSPNSSPTVTQASGVLGGLNDVSMPPQQNMWPLPLGNVASGLFQPQPVGGTQFCAGRPSLSPTSQHSSTVSSCALSQKSLQDVGGGSCEEGGAGGGAQQNLGISVTSVSSVCSTAAAAPVSSSGQGQGQAHDLCNRGAPTAADMQFHDSAYMESLMNAASLSQIHEQMSYMRVSQDLGSTQSQQQQMFVGGGDSLGYCSPSVGTEEMLLSGTVTSAGTPDHLSNLTPTDLSTCNGGDLFDSSMTQQMARSSNTGGGNGSNRASAAAGGPPNSQPGSRQFQDALSRPIPNIVLTESEGAEMDFFFSDADDGMGLQPLTDADLRMLNEGELNPDDETHMVTNQFDADMQTTSPSSSAGNDGAVDDVTANVPMLQS